MGSILTNTGAMVALQTLKSVNMNMEGVQSQISTGKDVATAKDNAAVWAISKVMESDVKGFEGISDSLGLGESTVAVASSASETVTDLLKEIKYKIVASQEDNVERSLIQADIDELRDQIVSVVGAAQFNGLNLLDAKSLEDGGNEISILSSLDRSTDGVSASHITVTKQDLDSSIAVAGTDLVAAGTAATTAIGAFGSGSETGEYATIEGKAAANAAHFYDEAGVNAGYSFVASGVGGIAFSEEVVYVAKEGDTAETVAAEMVNRLNFRAANDGLDVEFSVNGTNLDQIDVTNLSISAGITNAATDFTQTDTTSTATDDSASGTIGGGLDMLSYVDVSTEEGAEAALMAVEEMITTAIDSAASFGSAAGRIETQKNFVASLTDALEAGIGTLVDADMEEASARLQALQVQQQLAVQALSIANQQPQTLLSLFR